MGGTSKCAVHPLAHASGDLLVQAACHSCRLLEELPKVIVDVCRIADFL